MVTRGVGGTPSRCLFHTVPEVPHACAGCHNLQAGVHSYGEMGCCVLWVGSVFPRHSQSGPRAPRAMSKRSRVFASGGPVNCRSLHNGAPSEGERGCCVLYVGPFPPRHLLPGPRVPRATRRWARVFAGGGPSRSVLCFVVRKGGRWGEVDGGEISLNGV